MRVVFLGVISMKRMYYEDGVRCGQWRRRNLQVDTNVPEDRSASTLSPEPRYLSGSSHAEDKRDL